MNLSLNYSNLIKLLNVYLYQFGKITLHLSASKPRDSIDRKWVYINAILIIKNIRSNESTEEIKNDSGLSQIFQTTLSIKEDKETCHVHLKLFYG
jgi:hypothetical protein